PRRRRTVEDCQILPSEHDHTRPRTGLPPHVPRRAFVLTHGPSEGPTALRAPELTRSRRRRLAPAGNLTEPCRPKGPPGQAKREGLQKVGFALGVWPGENVKSSRWLVSEGSIVAEFSQFDPSDLHPLRLPSTEAKTALNSHRH